MFKALKKRFETDAKFKKDILQYRGKYILYFERNKSRIRYISEINLKEKTLLVTYWKK